MEPDQLEPDQPAARRSEGSWVWYGGRPSLDLVNTRRDRERSGAEYLCEAADLADWLRAAGRGDLAVNAGALAQAQELREAIDAGVRAAVAGQPFPVAELETLNRWLAAAPVISPQLRLSGGVAVLRSPEIPRTVAQVLSDIARDAAELLGTSQRSRLRICPGPGCAGRFTDDSPAGRRRWCSMAVCGNRSKAATHRQAVRV
jgi:predicted RNA-binding Zn ribbon-like protein